MSRRLDVLFSNCELRAVIEGQGQKLVGEIDSMDANRVLNTNPDELAAYFEQKYIINVLKIDEQNIQIDQAVVQVDSTSNATARHIAYLQQFSNGRLFERGVAASTKGSATSVPSSEKF